METTAHKTGVAVVAVVDIAVAARVVPAGETVTMPPMDVARAGRMALVHEAPADTGGIFSVITMASA
jgi:hypothetical protein